MPKKTVRAGQQQGTLDKKSDLCKIFVDNVRYFPEVRTILLSRLGDSARLWTVIEAPPFEQSIRNRIYAEQLKVLSMTELPVLDFRVVNLNEYDTEERELIVPENAQVLYVRTAF